MRFLDAEAIEAALSYPALVDVMANAFESGIIAPPRHHHSVHLEGRPDATLLLMPAWTTKAQGARAAGRYMGVKTVTVFPDNGSRGLPAVFAIYVLMSAETGQTLAVMDATRLTVWRTAAASALASRILSRPDSSRLLMAGAGALSSYLVRAHAAVRPIREVMIWNRTPERAKAVVAQLAQHRIAATVVTDLKAAVRRADIVSTATISSEPLIKGAWLESGTHVDLVGAYKPSMRESDDDVMRRARIFVDTEAGAFGEAGDILLAIASGAIKKSGVLGDLSELTQNKIVGRRSSEDITLFKSVGTSIEDLAAAIAVYEKR